MAFWIKKISWGKVILTAAIFTAISYVIHMIEAFLTIKYYMMPEYFGVWSKLMMPTAGPPPIEFTIISAVLSFVSGLLFALVYAVVKGSVPGKGWKNKGLMYGFLIFLVAGIPTTFMIDRNGNIKTSFVGLRKREIFEDAIKSMK